MPYEDDYKMWLEEMLIESNPDWVCDGMYDMDFTHEWCGKHCGEDSNYVTPKCLHLYYHYIAEADHKTENSSEKPNNCETCIWSVCNYNKVPWGEEDEPKTEPTISKMEQVEDDAYFLELMGAVERGEISDAGANQAWYEYINHKDEPQTEYRKWETKPNADRPTVNTTCVGVAMALVEDDEDEPQTERSV